MMNRKNIKRLIQETALKEMPDISTRFNLKDVEVIEPVSQKFGFFSLKRGLVLSLSFIFIFVSSYFVFQTISNNVPNPLPLESDTEAIGFQLVSSTSLLPILTPTDLSYSVNDGSIITLSETTIDTPLIETEIDTINSYMNMLESVLGDETYYRYSLEASDKPEYNQMLLFRGKDLEGNLDEYYIYMNTVESENMTSYEGIILHEEEEFSFSGNVFRNQYASFKVQVNDSNYIQVKNQLGSEEQMFQYKIFKNGALFNETEVVLASKKSNLGAQMRMYFGNSKYDLKVTKEQGQINKFNVEYEIQNGRKEQGNIEITLAQNPITNQIGYKYQINNGAKIYEIFKDRTEKGNAPAGDDDFIDPDPGNNDDDPGNNTSCPGNNPHC